jgi:hypothetical protein
VSGGFRLLTSDAPEQDAIMISSGPLLAASAPDWPGAGDPAGLRSLAAALYDSAPAISGRPRALDRQESQRADPARSDALAAVIRRAARIVEDLAAGLTRIENDLEDQAHTAARYGVRIGTDLRPPPAVAVPSASAGAASEQHWALAYQRVYAQATADGQRARQQAARQLEELHATLAPSRQPLAPSRQPLAPSRQPLAPSRQPLGPPAAVRLTIGQFLTALISHLAG